MQIQVNTDHNISGAEALAAHVRTVVESSLHRFEDRVSRVEVHLSDENGAKAGVDDKRCMMEARIEGRQPFAVTYHASSVHQAIAGAAERLERTVTELFDKLRESHR